MIARKLRLCGNLEPKRLRSAGVVGVVGVNLSECAQILAARAECRTSHCTDQSCRFSHPGDLLFDPAKGAPSCWPESFLSDTRPNVAPTTLAWWLLGPAYEQLESERFQLRCAQHIDCTGALQDPEGCAHGGPWLAGARHAAKLRTWARGGDLRRRRAPTSLPGVSGQEW